MLEKILNDIFNTKVNNYDYKIFKNLYDNKKVYNFKYFQLVNVDNLGIGIRYKNTFEFDNKKCKNFLIKFYNKDFNDDYILKTFIQRIKNDIINDLYLQHKQHLL